MVEITAALDTVTNSEQGSILTITDPASDEPVTFNGEALTITLRGRDASHYELALDQSVDKNMKIGARRGQMRLTRNDQKRDAISLLVSCTIGWNDAFANGISKLPVMKMQPNESLACTPASAGRVYQAVPWIREQVDSFVNDRKNFIKGTEAE